MDRRRYYWDGLTDGKLRQSPSSWELGQDGGGEDRAGHLWLRYPSPHLPILLSLLALQPGPCCSVDCHLSMSPGLRETSALGPWQVLTNAAGPGTGWSVPSSQSGLEHREAPPWTILPTGTAINSPTCCGPPRNPVKEGTITCEGPCGSAAPRWLCRRHRWCPMGLAAGRCPTMSWPRKPDCQGGEACIHLPSK